MTFHSGFNATAQVGAAELPIVSWRVDASADVVEFRNSKTGGYALREATYLDCAFTLVIDYDFDATPFAAPPDLTAGTTLSDVRLYLNGTGGAYWHFPAAVVTASPQQVEVEGKILTTIHCANDGAFGYPGSPVS